MSLHRFKMMFKTAVGMAHTEADAARSEASYDAKQAWGSMSAQEKAEAISWAKQEVAKDVKRFPEAYTWWQRILFTLDNK